MAQIYDDFDSYYTLYYTLWFEGSEKINYSVPGAYPVTYHVRDSLGNWNDPVTLIVYIV